MPTQDEMDINERLKYLRIMRKRYIRADRDGRGRLLDEMEQVSGLDRKTLIRRMNSKLERQPRRKQRGRTYGCELDDALRVIAESFDHIAAERLAPNLAWMAEHLASHGELEVSAALVDGTNRQQLTDGSSGWWDGLPLWCTPEKDDAREFAPLPIPEQFRQYRED